MTALATMVLLASGLASSDVVERRAVVPRPDRPHGEVRIVLRDGARVVQTLLHSRFVRRVAGEIAAKEERNWPAGATGHADSVRFVDALAEAARVAARGRVDAATSRRSLCIELPPAGPVTIRGASIESTDAGLQVTATAEPRHTLVLDAAYVATNRVLIVADAFAVDRDTAARWLSPP